MLSYKQYKLLEESFAGNITLGLGRQPSVGGGPINNLGFTSIKADELAETKRCSGKKKMDADADMDDDGDEEVSDELDIKKKPMGKPADDVDDSDDDSEGDDDGDEDDDDDGDEDMDNGEETDKMRPTATPFMKKNMKKNMKKKMTKEEIEWVLSLKKMMEFNPNSKHWDGISKMTEDSLLPPSNPNAGLDSNAEPQPGEVGYAPGGFSNEE